ncbi:uncharacterized protein LOC126580992 [Anopheles aquasalis]|uniref:uncharacterized protein LOC126580992 n=1 Tax=Anopheles aquasalis TaxID=42839 RepID=UPI00215A82F6|nr:uncharacterized protein LOC126580992 [Anopheles aquasalis]
MKDLDYWFNIREAQPDQRFQRDFNATSFPKLLQDAKNAEKQVKQLQARCDSMRKFISKLESNALPSKKQIKVDNDRLRQRLLTIRAKVGQTWKQYSELMGKLGAACDEFEFTFDRFEYQPDLLEIQYAERPLPAVIYRKLIAHWTDCNETINQAVLQIDSIGSDIVQPSEDALESVEKDIQALALQEQQLSTRVVSLDGQLQEYLRAHSLAYNPRLIPTVEETDEQARSLLSEIKQLQEVLHQQAPALKANEVKRIQNRIEEIKGLQQLQKTSCRVLNLNNAIIPIIEVLHVRQLQELNTLLARLSLTLLEELGGILRLLFIYRADDDDLNVSLNSFRTEKITGIRIVIIDEKDEEHELAIESGKPHLATLLVYISFLYVDGCKLLIMDEEFEHLFGGTGRMLRTVERNFPNMQFIRVSSKNQ